jgi:excisionase family DNA binding protein
MKGKKENLLTVKQVAELFGVTRITLWRWDRDGTLKAHKIGRNIRYKESVINKALK